MAEEGPPKVRFVRCPKCESLLTELPNYSVYECGGCGSLLRAKKKVTINGILVEKLERESDEDGFEKLESLSEKEDAGRDLGIGLEVERRKRDGALLDRGKERVFKEKTYHLVSNYKEIINSSNRIVREQIVGYQRGEGKGTDYNDGYKAPLNHPARNWVGNDGEEMNINGFESVNLSREKDMENISAQFKGSTGSLRSRAMVGKWGLNRDGSGGRHGNLRIADERSNVSNFASYPDEGPSNYNYVKSSSHGHGQLLKNFDNRFEHLEPDRAELIRKLDELKEQICRSSSAAEKQTPPGFYNHDRAPYNFPVKPLAPDKHVPRPLYFRQNDYGHVVRNSEDMNMQNFYFPPKHNANKFPVYKNSVQLQMPRSDSHPAPDRYSQQPLRDYYLGTHEGFDREPLASYPRGTMYHKPACACFHCYNKKWHVPSQVPASVFGRKYFMEEPTVSNFNHQVDHIKSRSGNPTPQVNHRALHSRDAQSDIGWPSDIDSNMDVFRHSHLGRVVVAHGDGRICHPITGGAPFIACSSCFESLKLPRKCKLREKNQQKLQCGACSTVLFIEIRNKKLVMSIPVKNKQILAEAADGSRGEGLWSPEGDFNAEGTNCSVDLDNVGYDFQSADFKGNVLPEDRRLNLNESRARHSLTSLSSVSSGEDKITDSMIVQRDLSDFPELPTKDDTSSTYLRPLFMESLDDISSNNKINRNGEGDESNKEVILDKDACRENNLNNISSETEVEVSFSEFLNTTTSQDSLEVSKEDLQPRINKGSESFLVGLLKKSFRDFSRSNQHNEYEKPNVFVNGQPIPDSMVKKAEKLAGPIHPGDYWYDSQAGFWGLMGQPCLGIIPPCIKEFNYPMPENCSLGNTSVFVNGRELHQKDLDLLKSRGLPTTKEKFYIIEISGRVFEKDSGKELKSLGKLAPTVEKMKRGFGMKVPRKLV
ncbi:conserved hypothetical protein [Ricinus communis]|uniref:Uncharacterized protein n=1 Tax=Ricinus communis TaxID=3988 RepID=B9RCP8_RICCO|nr:conserved hypothetical protein [Ricinus communis]|eukprot:XP_002509932.1 protein ENHANCED DISEASE RESISTANCE 4 [Ricinus communis]